MSKSSQKSSNPRLQRARSHAPLSRKPLGDARARVRPAGGRSPLSCELFGDSLGK